MREQPQRQQKPSKASCTLAKSIWLGENEATTTSGATTSSGLDSGNGSTATTSKPTLGQTKIL